MRDKMVLVIAVLALFIAVIIFLKYKTSTPNQAEESNMTNLVNITSPLSTLDAYKSLDNGVLQKMMEQGKLGNEIIIIDVREPSEYSDGHIAGSKNIPLGLLENRMSEIPKDKEVVLICRSGRRSLSALNMLKSQGYIKIHNFDGGMLGYTGAVTSTK